MSAATPLDMVEAAPALRPKVLYVDDQPGNLLVFKASFKRHADIRTVTSALEALEILGNEEFPIVVSDQRMAGMTGTQFLAEVRRRHPDTIRMLLTAHTQFEDVVAAINDGQVSRFISKPWDRQDLLAALIGATELYWKVKENRTLTEQLLHRERLAAIGQVTSGLVHELGNIAAVLTVAEDLRTQWRDGIDSTRELEILQGGIDKFSMLVESLRVYSKGGDQLQVTKTPEDLNAIVSSTIVMLKLFRQVKGLARLDWTPSASPVVASVDRKKLEQVLLNVVKNAAEACTGPNGRVAIEVQGGATPRITIKDNGPGIPPDAAKKIWQGFYTTKGERGTGLGLAMCQKIMKAHGGSIRFENDPTGGCTFVIELPGAS